MLRHRNSCAFLFSTASPQAIPGGIAIALLLPALYRIVGFVAVLIGTAIYNFVAARVGGIEIELAENATL